MKIIVKTSFLILVIFLLFQLRCEGKSIEEEEEIVKLASHEPDPLEQLEYGLRDVDFDAVQAEREREKQLEAELQNELTSIIGVVDESEQVLNERLFAWAKVAGIQHQVELGYFKYPYQFDKNSDEVFDVYVRGLKTIRTVQPRETLVSAPRKAVLVRETLSRPVRKFLDYTLDVPCQLWHGRTYLTLGIMLETLFTKWRPYLDHLHSSATQSYPNTPVMWPREKTLNFYSENVANIAQAKHNALKETFQKVKKRVDALPESIPGVSKHNYDAMRAMLNRLTERIFIREFTLIDSRYWRSRFKHKPGCSAPMLVPIADLANIGERGPDWVNTFVFFDQLDDTKGPIDADEGDFYRMVAGRHYLAGDEIVNRYDDDSKETFIIEYGVDKDRTSIPGPPK